jgi:hypothetical protein
MLTPITPMPEQSSPPLSPMEDSPNAINPYGQTAQAEQVSIAHEKVEELRNFIVINEQAPRCPALETKKLRNLEFDDILLQLGLYKVFGSKQTL